eukprot:m.152934 g.152934  ORF g.152934 m.152934 type:complete len:150 (+) comp15114_c0_seq3:4265-4714(+)
MDAMASGRYNQAMRDSLHSKLAVFRSESIKVTVVAVIIAVAIAGAVVVGELGWREQPRSQTNVSQWFSFMHMLIIFTLPVPSSARLTTTTTTSRSTSLFQQRSMSESAARALPSFEPSGPRMPPRSTRIPATMSEEERRQLWIFFQYGD